MRREQLAHILRAAARITTDGDILVIGSQAILGSFDEDQLPVEAWRSVEADVPFFNDPSDIKSDQVDGASGKTPSQRPAPPWCARARTACW